MKLIFMGTPALSVPVLHEIAAAGHTILAVVTQPDRPVGREQTITQPPVKVFALAHSIPVLQPEKIRTPEARAGLEPPLKQSDAAVVAAYGRILPAWMLAAPRLGCVNVHFSLLPKYRGAAPINWAIACGERETGVTIMQMDEGLDTGPILLQSNTPIGENETAPDLTTRLAAMGAGLLVDTLARLEYGTLTPISQDSTLATHAPILRREDGQINWKRSARETFNRLRGFTPFPGCFTMLGTQRLEIVRATPEESNITGKDHAPGTVIEVARENFAVQCGGESQLRVDEVQPAGRRPMSARDFLNGTHLKVGAQLG
jgi:methionyl-tRNA formyltransferase